MRAAGGVLLLLALVLMGISAVLGLTGAANVAHSATVFVAAFLLGLTGATLIDKGE